MKKSAIILTVLALFLFSWTQTTRAQTLYGAAAFNGGGDGDGDGDGDAEITPAGTGGGQSNFYRLDPDTGAATLIGPIGFNGVTGMAFLPDGTLLATANGDSMFPGPEATSILIRIDPTTGAGTLIGAVGDSDTSCGRIPGLTYDRMTQSLFGYGDYCVDSDNFVLIDPVTATGTLAPNITGFTDGGNGLAIQANTGILFSTPRDNNSLVTIDPVTGIGTEIPASVGNVADRISSLDFNPLNGVLYGSHNDNGNSGNWFLVTIDTADGTTTSVGQTVQGLDAIVFSNFCGDGEIIPGEECDDGNDIDNDECSNDCLINLCGNGSIDVGEECDDGNLFDGDGCSSLCIAELLCGNGIVDDGEQCDDGNEIDNDGCSNNCVILLNFDVSGSGCALQHGPDGSPMTLGALGMFTLVGLALFRRRSLR